MGCSHRGDARVEVLVLSDECSSNCLIPQHRGYLANVEFARFILQIRSPCKIVLILLSLDCKNVRTVYHQPAFYLRWHYSDKLALRVYTSVYPYAFVCGSSKCVRVCVCARVHMRACA